MSFQDTASRVSLPESAKLATLKVALDSTGADLPPWSEPAGSLQDLIWRLCNYTTGKSIQSTDAELNNLALVGASATIATGLIS
ncbi:hypothetical protein DSO57_1029228 [Entomophthora muscae]|uniref:Uncharacterized protein n=1 Tax=Entomophthora muscae TaxID=34485 RepID=A0ACC2ULY7_9FUNG|nr:hypothetical protein DSO57_1029228 [Entomophthora muscae]